MKKQIISFFLALVMVFSVVASVDLTAFAGNTENSSEFIDPEVYKAQCLSGVAKDEKSDAASQCHNLYNYYINENIFSPTQSFLDSCYEDESLMKKYDMWKQSSLASDPSSALNLAMKREDYYETLIIAMYSKATAEDNQFQELLKNKAINQSKSIISSMCEIKKITEVSQIVDAVNINDPETIAVLEKCVSATYSLATAKKVCGVIGDIISYSKDILDVADRLAVYGSMAELDSATKLWLNQMYSSCTSETDGALKSALKTLTLASTDAAGAALADIKETAFTLTKWSVKATVNIGIAGLCAGNPALAAVFAGLKAGKTICNIFFATDDVCEQLYMMECIFDVQDLSRRVAEDCRNTFIGEQTAENAKAFLYAVDCYYEAIIHVDIDCMEKFLDKLYNGGILSGLIKWIFGVTDDYQECINALEGLREARQNNYTMMSNYFKEALRANYPDTFELYFTADNTVPVTGISFVYGIFPPDFGYPEGANLLVGEFRNIDVQYTPSNTTQKGFTAASDNPAVVRIEGNMMVGVAEGTAKVTVTSTADPFVFHTEEITVKKRLENSETDGKLQNCFTYTVENGETTITGLVDGYKPSNLYIPSKIDGISVTKIGSDAFRDCTSLTSVLIPDSVTSIGSFAFFCCTSLTSVIIGDSVTSIGWGAFAGCTSLTSVEIPNSVTNIGECAFYGCTSLTSVEIPNSVTSIGGGAFEYCTSLTSIEIAEGNAVYSSVDGVLLNKSGTELIAYPNGKSGIYTIPSGVASIAPFAFYGCTSLTSVVIPDSVTNIGECAFYGCTSLTNVIIPDGVTNIEDLTFSYCTSLTSIEIPDSVTSIGNSAFSGCTGLTSIEIPDGVTSIGEDAFYACTSLTSIEIPDSVTSIGYAAFGGCTSLTSVEIPDSVTEIGDYAFGYYADENMETILKVDGFTVYGVKGSAAETYAIQNGFAFVPIQAFEDADSGISMTVTNADALAENTALQVKTVSTADSQITYDIALISNGAEVQPAGEVTVKIPVPDTMDGTQCKVYRQEADGTYTDMHAVYQNGYMVFTTDHFSIYVLTTEDPNKPVGTPGDINGDGQVTAVDARWALQAASGVRQLTEEQAIAADVNGDGKITAVDARWILQAASGVRTL